MEEVKEKRSAVDPEAAYRTIWMIALSLPIGVTLFAMVIVVFAGGLTVSQSSLSAPLDMVTQLWFVLAGVCMIGAWHLWRTKVVPVVRSSKKSAEAKIGELQSAQILVWAVIEVAGLSGVAVYNLNPSLVPVITALVISWGGTLIFRPRRSWYIGRGIR